MDGDWLVRRDLGDKTQSIVGLRLDRNPEIGCVRQVGGQLEHNDRRVPVRKRVGMDSDRGTRFTVIAGRGDSDDVTAPHREPETPLR